MENTTERQVLKWSTKDHLHIRGEYSAGAIGYQPVEGSPPHTWRIHRLASVLFVYPRITSTYVENTNSHTCQNHCQKDHLHIRGEYCKTNNICFVEIGSPPHTWRIPLSWFSILKYSRITSTYVENTTWLIVLVTLPSGSPPHTWRILWFHFSAKLHYRITSTYVENTQ